jgi:hypothetical protein
MAFLPSLLMLTASKTTKVECPKGPGNRRPCLFRKERGRTRRRSTNTLGADKGGRHEEKLPAGIQRIVAVTVLAGANLLATAPPAAADPVCVPINDANDEPIVYVCINESQNNQGLPIVRVQAGAPGAEVDVVVSVVTGHVPEQQRLCVNLLPNLSDGINVCVLPTP